MNWIISSKLILGLLGVGSMIGIAGTIINDHSFSSTNFMEDDEIQLSQSLDDYYSDRDVASAKKMNKFTIPYIPVNHKNKNSINRLWEITRITNDKDVVVYDTSRVEDKKTIIELPITLISTSKIQIDKDKNLRFNILFFHKSRKTISFIRSFGKGFEIVEARRAQKVKMKLIKQSNSYAKLNNTKKDKKGEVSTMRLHKALFPTRTAEILQGNLVDGSIKVSDGNIDNFEFTLKLSDIDKKDIKGKSDDISVSVSVVQIHAGGQFSFEYEEKLISGIITRNGKEGHKIRFVTGALMGASLNFVTENEFDKLEELQLDQSYARADLYSSGNIDIQARNAASVAASNGRKNLQRNSGRENDHYSEKEDGDSDKEYEREDEDYEKEYAREDEDYDKEYAREDKRRNTNYKKRSNNSREELDEYEDEDSGEEDRPLDNETVKAIIQRSGFNFNA